MEIPQANGNQMSYILMYSMTLSGLLWKVPVQQKLQCSLGSALQHEAVARVQSTSGLIKFL